jgi:vitamin B12 transporter
MIKRIEIAPGNQSAEFGDQAMGGVINIIATDQTVQKANSIQLSQGSFNTQKYQYATQLSGENITGQGSIKFQKTDNNYSHLFEDELIPRDNAQFTKQNLFVSISSTPSSNTLIQITGISYNNNMGLPGPTYELTPTANQVLNSQILTGSFLYQPDSWQLATEYSYNRSHQELVAEAGIYPGYNKTYDSKNIHLGLTASYTHDNNLHIRTKLETNHAWLAGKDILIPRFSLGEHQRNSVEMTASLDRVIQFPDLASKITPHLTIHHYDVEFHDSDNTWSISLKHETELDLLQFNTWLRTGTAYKLPSFWQMFWVSSAFAEGNPDLKPEHSKDFETGLRISLKRWSAPWFTLTKYEQKYENLITWKRGYGNRFYPVNLQSALVSGLNFSTGLSLFANRINITGNHSIVNAINATPGPNSEGNYLPFRPLGESSLNLDTKIKALLVSLTYREQKRTYIREANTKWLDPFQKLDLTCSYMHSFRSFALLTTMRIDNLTSEQYEVLERFPMPGRYSEIYFEIKF